MIFRYQIDSELALELHSPEQAEELYELLKANQDFIGEHLHWAKRVRNLQDFRHYMQRDLDGMVNERRWSWLIRYQGQVAGRIGIFVTMPEIREAELNYWIGENFTGKGIVTRAARAVVDFAFATLNMQHVLIGFAEHNPKSGAIAERLGFQREFVYREGEIYENAYYDSHFWGMTAQEWQISDIPVFEHDLGDGLALRLHQVYDAEVQYQLVQANLEDFSRYFWWANENHSLENEIAHTKGSLAGYGIGEALLLGIWQDKALVGSISLSLDPNERDVSMGYWLTKSARGKGIMTRAAQAALQYAFETQQMERVYLQASLDNKTSRALAERLGMVEEAILRENQWINGRFVSHALYSILASEYSMKEKV